MVREMMMKRRGKDVLEIDGIGREKQGREKQMWHETENSGL